MSQLKSLIIIPTFNEIENIEKMVRTVFSQEYQTDLLIVDDLSPDGTAKKVKELQNEFSQLHLLERDGEKGLGRAYIAGFKWALKKDYECIIEMDCDFSHDPKDVGGLLESIKEADLVIGSRYINGIRILNWPIQRLLLSYGASIYIRIVTGIPVLDATGGFKCFRRQVLEAIDLDRVQSNGYAFQLEMNYKTWKKKFRIKEHPIVFTERRDGESKMSKKIVIEALWMVVWLRTKALLRIL